MDDLIFDLIFEDPIRKRAGFPGHTSEVDMGLYRNNHGNVWGELNRAQLLFMMQRIADYLDDTARDQNLVYTMACGHEYDVGHRMSRNNRGHCSQHGFQPLVDGEFLPTWKEWVAEQRAKRTGRTARSTRNRPKG